MQLELNRKYTTLEIFRLDYDEFCGIYRLDIPNGKFYYGSSNHVIRRWREHLYACEDLTEKDANSMGTNPGIYRSYRKYGSGEFSWSLVELTSQENKYDREEEYLRRYVGTEGCLNVNKRAFGPPDQTGSTWSKEVSERRWATRRKNNKPIKMPEGFGITMSFINRGKSQESHRRGGGKKTKPSRPLLTAAEVIEIRELALTRTYVEVGSLFGVTPESISNIVNRRTWRNIP